MKAATAVLESARAVPAATARAATTVPETARTTPAVATGAARQAPEPAWGDPGGGNRGHQPEECGDASQLYCWIGWLQMGLLL